MCVGLSKNKLQCVCVHGNEWMSASATVWFIDVFLKILSRHVIMMYKDALLGIIMCLLWFFCKKKKHNYHLKILKMTFSLIKNYRISEYANAVYS